jgi:hypothetical protein
MKEMRDYHFRLQGHGQDIDAGTYKAESEEKAFKEARKACRRFEIPGWRLVCLESGTSEGAATLKTPGGDVQRV